MKGKGGKGKWNGGREARKMEQNRRKGQGEKKRKGSEKWDAMGRKGMRRIRRGGERKVK